MPTDLLIIGAGGHARVVYDAVLKSPEEISVSVAAEDPALSGTTFMDLTVAAPLPKWSALTGTVHVAIGNNLSRERILTNALLNNMESYSVLHPTATIALSAKYDYGCFIAAGAIIGPVARLGTGVIVNHGAVVDHDCKIGAFVHIAPNVTLGGNVSVGDGVLIGSGSVILPGVSIGNWAVIGSGAVVNKNVASNETVAGVPARKI